MNNKKTGGRPVGSSPYKWNVSASTGRAVQPGRGRPASGGGRSRPSSGGGRKRSGGGGGRKKGQPSFDPSQFINKNPIDIKEEVYVAKHKFSDFPIDRRLSGTIEKMGLITPSPIQDQIIPEIIAGRDVIGLAETGTGKTAAFLIPLIHKTFTDNTRTTLILTPTRELAIQIEQEFRKLAWGLRLFSTTCVGGMSIWPQIKSLKRTNHFIIGTPGRVMDLIDRKHIDPSIITTVVLDEADRMLDMGFVNDMRSILGGTPNTRETLFFSATMNKQAEGLTSEFMRDPVTVSVKKKDVTNSILQDVVPYETAHKYDTLVNLLKDDKEFSRVIIFGSMKHSVDKLGKALTASGIKAEALHGDKDHRQRQRALQNFKDNRARVLVATDVAARGIHVDNVSHVINYDLPGTFDDYVHRIGRTGRGDMKGKALTFVAR